MNANIVLNFVQTFVFDNNVLFCLGAIFIVLICRNDKNNTDALLHLVFHYNKLTFYNFFHFVWNVYEWKGIWFGLNIYINLLQIYINWYCKTCCYNSYFWVISDCRRLVCHIAYLECGLVSEKEVTCMEYVQFMKMTLVVFGYNDQ